MNEVIQTSDLCKKYGKKQALSSLTIAIPEHSITGLIGRNGSGKTTLMKICAGLLDKTSGTVKVLGEDPMDNLTVLRQMVYTEHNMGYDKNHRLETILYGYENMFPNFDAAFAKKLMNYFELSGKTKYKSLSQGMGSVFHFLCALSCRAPITMLDEPVLGMDISVRKEAYEILIRDYSEHPRTFLISSHLLAELEGVLSDILLIDGGKLVLHSSIDDIRQSAYRVDGTIEELAAFCANKKVIATKTSEIQTFAVIYEPLTQDVEASSALHGLSLSSVRPEDLCVYLTKQDKEAELECLW